MSLLLLALLACGPKKASLDSPAAGATALCRPEDWPEEVRATMTAAHQRGLLLAARDRLAWEATDRVMEQVQRDKAAEGLMAQTRGYLIDQPAGGDPVVHFVVPGDAGPRSAIQVRFDAAHPKGAVEIPDAPLLLSEPLAAAYRATRTSVDDPRFVPKAPTYNPDVVPWSDDPAEGWAVYLIPGASDYNDVPLGGGYRAHVSPDGTQILEFLPLSQSVISVPVADVRSGPDGMFIVTTLTPLPDATYIAFASVWEIGLFVVTTDDVWAMGGPSLCWIDSDTLRPR